MMMMSSPGDDDSHDDNYEKKKYGNKSDNKNLVISIPSKVSFHDVVVNHHPHHHPPQSPLSPKQPKQFSSSRRQAMSSLVGCTITIVSTLSGRSTIANAVITDETDNFADNWWSSSPKDGVQKQNDNDNDSSTASTSSVSSSSTSLSSSSSSSSSSSASSSSMTTANGGVNDDKDNNNNKNDNNGGRPLLSDEISIPIPKQELQSKQGIGLELKDVEFRTNRRVYVKSISPGSIAEQLGIQKDWILVSINGKSTERTDAAGVAIMVYRAVNDDTDNNKDNSVEFRFRDPALFRNKLNNLSSSSSSTSSSTTGGGDGENEVSTLIAPAGDTTRRNLNGSVQSGYSVTEQDDQRLVVSQLIPPKLCNRKAQMDDLMEISYVGRVVETGAIFDGSAVMINGQGIPGRANDVSIFFVLGKQPFGQFPPGWDVGLVGMCVGERRRLLVPPVLAYGSTGLPRRGIPPNATLQYDITLVSLNGLATPQ